MSLPLPCVCGLPWLVQLALGQQVHAAQMYRHYLRRPDVLESSTVHLCIARCEVEMHMYKACISTLKRAIRLAPSNLHLWCVPPLTQRCCQGRSPLPAPVPCLD